MAILREEVYTDFDRLAQQLTLFLVSLHRTAAEPAATRLDSRFGGR